MTPLAQSLLRFILANPRHEFRRTALGQNFLAGDTHCFDCSSVTDLAEHLILAKEGAVQTVAYSTFLPAPSTWIEYRDRIGGRVGALLAETTVAGAPESKIARVYMAQENAQGALAVGKDHLRLFIYLTGSGGAGQWGIDSGVEPAAREKALSCLTAMIAMLAMINSPRVIGRSVHLPHAGLQRALARDRKMVGKFPLQAWTEIKLEVRPPVEDAVEYDAHLTGSRALHFVRKHYRIRLGRLELVRSHWRGDAALGIKRSRYVLAKPKDMTAAEATIHLRS